MRTETALRVAQAGAVQPSLAVRFGRNRLVPGGFALALLAAGLAWQWNWLVAIGVAPLLLSAAPCVAMCAAGLCMRRMSGRTCDAVPPGHPAGHGIPKALSATKET